MTVPKVEVGFVGPARRTAFQLDDATYGLLDSGVLGIGVELVDLTDRLVSLQVRRGRVTPVDVVDAGRAVVVLRNNDGLLDPLNTSSTLYPGVEPRRPVNLYADGVQVYAGFVDDIDLGYSPGGDAIVTLTASDGLARLALAEFPSAGLAVSEQDSGARVSAVIASDSDYWSGTTSVETGDSTLAAGTATGNVLSYLQQVERSEGGFLFVGRSGALTFRNRNAPAANPGGLVLSDVGGTACTPYVELSRQAGVEALFNVVTAVYQGSTAVATEPTSVSDYGFRELDLQTLLLSSAEATQSRVDYEVARRADVLTSVRSVTVDQSSTPSGCSLTLQHDLGDSVTVVFTPPGVTQQTASAVLVGVEQAFTAGRSWRTTFVLAPRDDAQFLILDDVSFGLLDVGALAF